MGQGGADRVPYLIAHEQANGLAGLDPDGKVAFSVGRQDVALVIDDLEKNVCESHPIGLPNTPAPPKHRLVYSCDTSGESLGRVPDIKKR